MRKKKSCGCCDPDRKSNHLFIPNYRRSRETRERKKNLINRERKKEEERKREGKNKPSFYSYVSE
jgi:hypothetical protein